MYAAAITSLIVNFSGLASCRARKEFSISCDSVGLAWRSLTSWRANYEFYV